MKEPIDFTKFHKDDYERIQKLRLIDDDFAEVVFKDKACTEFLLNGVLKRNDIKVRDVTCQYAIKNLHGRSIRLDVFAIDETNTVYDVEIQRSDAGATEKRARYNSSLIDASLAKRGDSYKSLNDSFVIFITENDVFNQGLPVYTIKRCIMETGEIFDDGSTIIYVNSQCQGTLTLLEQIMHDFYCNDPDKMYCNILANRVRYFKKEEEGVRYMCRMMEEMRDEVATAAKLEERKHLILTFYQNGVSIDLISKSTGMSVKEIKSVISNSGNVGTNLNGMSLF